MGQFASSLITLRRVTYSALRASERHARATIPLTRSLDYIKQLEVGINQMKKKVDRCRTGLYFAFYCHMIGFTLRFCLFYFKALNEKSAAA